MNRLFTLIILIIGIASYAQNIGMNNQLTKNEDLIRKSMPLDKNQLIYQANIILNNQYPNFIYDSSSYEITVWKNSKKTIVKYRRIIRFTPLDKKEKNLCYDFEVDLTNQNISPFDFWGIDNFYIPTLQEEKKIKFVIEAFGLPRFGFKNSIIENANIYNIYIDNEVAFGKYFIDKITGKECMGSIEGSYASIPDFPKFNEIDPLIEIKE